MTPTLHTIIDELPPVVLRKDLTRLSFGLVNSRTLANKDSKGIGVRDAFLVGRRVAYHRWAVAEYLEQQVTPLQRRGPSSSNT